jgi:hypothetical protein
MALRDPSPMPSAIDLTRFLASSITFMRHLSEVTVYFDDKRLVKLNNVSGLPQEISIPKGYSNRSPEKMMTVTSIESRRAHFCHLITNMRLTLSRSCLHPGRGNEMDVHVWDEKTDNLKDS